MPRQMTVRLDTKDEVVTGLTVGDEAEVRIQGKIVELSMSRELDFGPDDTETIPAELVIEPSSVKVTMKESNAFAELAEDE